MSSSTVNSSALSDAFSKYSDDRKSEAYAILKVAFGWSVSECKAALEEYAKRGQADLLPSGDANHYIDAALKSAGLLDELTLITVKKLRAAGLRPKQIEGHQQAYDAVESILKGYEVLVSMDINPSRAIETYLGAQKGCLLLRDPTASIDLKEMQVRDDVAAACAHSLRDDLVDLL